MTAVLIRLTHDSPAGPTEPVTGTMSWAPTRRRTAGDEVVLPEGFRVTLPVDVPVLVAPTGSDWCWRVVESAMAGGTRYVAVPALPDGQTVTYADLVDVDPATLDPAAEPAAAWDIALEALDVRVTVLETEGVDPEMVAQAVADYLATHPVESITGVTAHGLPAGSDPTASLDDGVLTLGIPAGQPGAPGTPGAPGAPGAPGTPGGDGTDGREVELRTSAGWVQWRYVGATWTDLISLADLTGPAGSDGTDGADGLSVELRRQGTDLQWRQAGGAWAALVPLADITGPQGSPGPATTLWVDDLSEVPPGTPADTLVVVRGQ
ncbi:MAG: hypothetical protein QM804_10390 [Propionicimonas sp.]